MILTVEQYPTQYHVRLDTYNLCERW